MKILCKALIKFLAILIQKSLPEKLLKLQKMAFAVPKRMWNLAFTWFPNNC